MAISAPHLGPTAEDDAYEESVLGACLLGGAATVLDVAEIVTDADFTKGARRDTWAACRHLATAGQAVDPISVLAELEKRGPLPMTNTHLWLFDVMDVVGHTASARYHAGIIAERGRRRRIAKLATTLAERALDPTVELDPVLRKAVDCLLAAGASSGAGLVRVADVLDAAMAVPLDFRGVRTGWAELDQLYRPVPGQLVLIGGHPGDGKSTWLDCLLTHQAMDGEHRFALWSPESAPVEDHARRLAVTWAGRSWGRLAQAERQAALQCVDESFSWVNHDTHGTVDGVLSQVRAAHQRQRLSGFVIDPWTNVESTRDTRTREDEWIGQQLTTVQKFARRHQITAYVVVHPRNVEPQNGIRPVPTTAHLHGGSIWAKKADAILTVWRDATGRTRDPALTDVHVQKVRHQDTDGRLGVAHLRFDPATRRFTDYAAEGGRQQWTQRKAR